MITGMREVISEVLLKIPFKTNKTWRVTTAGTLRPNSGGEVILRTNLTARDENGFSGFCSVFEPSRAADLASPVITYQVTGTELRHTGNISPDRYMKLDELFRGSLEVAVKDLLLVASTAADYCNQKRDLDGKSLLVSASGKTILKDSTPNVQVFSSTAEAEKHAKATKHPRFVILERT
jgi:hypothetical protein